MSRLLPRLRAPHGGDPRIAVGAAVLAVLAVIGTAPSPQGAAPEAGAGTELATSGQTFADLFQEMRDPEQHGEGRAAVAIASAAPDIPTVEGAGPSAMPTPTASVPAEVSPARPSLVVRGVDAAIAPRLVEVPGVAAAAAATVAEVALRGPAGPQTMTVAAVDPLAFRPLTPDLTAREPAVWERLLAGDAAFTHDAGTRLGAPLGATVQALRGLDGAALDAAAGGTGVPGASQQAEDAADALGAAVEAADAVVGAAADGIPVRLGALASNGIPPVADALVSTATGAALGITGPADVYVAVAEGADAAAVAQAVADAAGAEVQPLEAPQTQTQTFGAFLVGAEARSFFEPFDYIDHGDGLITIEPDWVQRNIATTTMIPLLPGRVTCHRQMLRQLYAAMSEVEAAGLGPLIDPSQYGGCWVARHIDFNPSKPISMHGWGLAVDMNVSTNGLGQRPTMDPRIVEIFDRWGFVWGGRWNRPDGMHFEIGAVIDVPVPDGFYQ